MSINEVTSDDFDREVIQESNNRPVVVDFWAPYCGPCRMISQYMDELSQEYDGKVIFFKLNIDVAQDIASRYNIMSIPTVIVFRNGEVNEAISGARKKEAFKAKFDEILSE